MSVTFIIGNGFDLHMGMKTKYVDVYSGYIKSESKNENIIKFKELLKKDAPNEYTNWADFEQKMGESTDKFDSEQDFVDCVRDFKEYLARNLENEEKAFFGRIDKRTKTAISNEIKRSIYKFYYSLIVKDKKTIENLIVNKTSYYFIFYNYTSVLEKLLSYVIFSDLDRVSMTIFNPLYVHGKNSSGIVLGVDNEEQLNKKCNYSFTKKIRRAFVKPYFNNLSDPNNTTKIKKVIMNSNVICVYGLSFGKTDLMWVETIIEWLKSNPNNHLVYFKYSNKEYNLWHKDLIMDVEDEYKDELLKRINYANHDFINDLFDQVHIPVGYNIFNIKEVVEKEEIKIKEEQQLKEKAKQTTVATN